MFERFWKVFEQFLEMFLKSFWTVFDKVLNGFWKVFEKVFERFLKGFWKAFERLLNERFLKGFWKVVWTAFERFGKEKDSSDFHSKLVECFEDSGSCLLRGWLNNQNDDAAVHCCDKMMLFHLNFCSYFTSGLCCTALAKSFAWALDGFDLYCQRTK